MLSMPQDIPSNILPEQPCSFSLLSQYIWVTLWLHLQAGQTRIGQKTNWEKDQNGAARFKGAVVFPVMSPQTSPFSEPLRGSAVLILRHICIFLTEKRMWKLVMYVQKFHVLKDKQIFHNLSGPGFRHISVAVSIAVCSLPWLPKDGNCLMRSPPDQRLP